MAGGQGIRLWPLSRTAKPKQFQKLVSSKTLLEETAARLVPEHKWEDIFVSANEAYAEMIREQLPKLPPANVIAEPSFRERMAALALTLAYIPEKEHPTIVLMSSDHYVKDREKLMAAVLAAEQFLREHPDYVVGLGAKPNYPEPGYGYIEFAPQPLGVAGGETFFQATGFVEKPTVEAAGELLAKENYLWNCGIYIFKHRALLSRMERLTPEIFAHYLKIKSAIGTPEEATTVQKEYVLMDMISMEREILAKDDKFAVVNAEMGWSDVGTWALLKDALAENAEAGISYGDHWDADSVGTLVYGSAGRLIATIGLKDLVIVDTPDALLVCDKKRSAEVKKVVDNLRGTGRKQLL